MGIYKHSGPFEMFVRIATNNLYVSLLFFISGLVFSYGSVVLMFFNGIMLGTFMYFFYSRGITTEFNYTVWMHGEATGEGRNADNKKAACACTQAASGSRS